MHEAQSLRESTALVCEWDQQHLHQNEIIRGWYHHRMVSIEMRLSNCWNLGNKVLRKWRAWKKVTRNWEGKRKGERRGVSPSYISYTSFWVPYSSFWSFNILFGSQIILSGSLFLFLRPNYGGTVGKYRDRSQIIWVQLSYAGWQNLAAFRREQKWQWKFSSCAYLQFLRQMRRFWT